MNDFPQKQLLVNYLLGICTSREEEEVESWLNKDRENCLFLEQVAKELGQKNQFQIPEKEEIKKKLFQQIDQFSHPAFPKAKSMYGKAADRGSFYKRKSFWLKMAAMFLVISLAGIVGLYLENDQLGEAQENTVLKRSSISNGQTASLQFGDGTVVKLNGGSTLSYPETFSSDQREIYLEGEAFFEVTPDESRPFIVHTGNISTEVLGTSFNIKAYESENEVQVAVAEGLVAVTQLKSDNSSNHTEQEKVLLKENQWLTYRSLGQILEKGEGNIREIIAWKDRVLLFSNKSFAQVAEMLERWYGVGIEIEDEDLKSQILEGEHQDASLREVLNSLQVAMNFEYEIDGKNVRIY